MVVAAVATAAAAAAVAAAATAVAAATRATTHSGSHGTLANTAGHMAITLSEQSMTAAHAPTKKIIHDNDATATNRMGGDNYWPKSNRISLTDQGHISYKGKLTPN